MPKCSLCSAETRQVRGVAGAQGWTFMEIYGPGGNKYAVFCPDSKEKDIREKVLELLAKTQKK